MFSVGDHVRIRTWDDMEQEFGSTDNEIDCGCVFVKEMRPLCGMEFTIKEIGGGQEENCYAIVVFEEEPPELFGKHGMSDLKFTISTDMIEHFDAKDSPILDESFIQDMLQ